MFPLFVVFVAILWLAIVAALALMSGWSLLARTYPDRQEPNLLLLKWQSGMLGRANMRGMLRLAVCPSGLRIGARKIFGPWNPDFLVPWNEIRISRHALWFATFVELRFGDPEVGKLRLAAHTADCLARASMGRWPETGPFPEQMDNRAPVTAVKEWAAKTVVAALLFIFVPPLIAPNGPHPPIELAITIPAVAFAIIGVVKYNYRIRR